MQAGQRDDFRRHIGRFLEVKMWQHIFSSTYKGPDFTMKYNGFRNSYRKSRVASETCKIRAFGPPKRTLGPVFASQNTVKTMSFVGHEAEKRRLL